MPSFRLGRLAMLAVLILPLAVAAAHAAPRVAVNLQDGRQLTGELDRRTNSHLWLRFAQADAEVTRVIDWRHVDAMHIDGVEATPGQLRTLAADLPEPVRTPPATAVATPTQPSTAPEKRRPVAGVTFDVFLSDWDADVEADGLQLHLYPIDAAGRLTPIDGTITVQLVASRQSRQRPERMGYWTQTVRREQFTPNGAVVHLPYRAKDPELDTSIERQGLVHLRLSVPGHGTFEHSRDAVRIRSYSPVRDTHQRATGRRYFPGERTRGQR